MATTLEIQTQTNMAYEWLTANGTLYTKIGVDFEGSCYLIHDGHCIFDVLRVLKDVGKIGMKYYVSFHLIPLILRLRKCKDK